MKLTGIMTYMSVTVGSQNSGIKSDGNPQKRIKSLGGHLSNWVHQNFCGELPNGKSRCLPAKDTWADRITVMVEKLAERYDKCGSVPDRTRRRREDTTIDNNDDKDEDDDVLMMARYNKNDPTKAVSQLCTAIAKWTKDYLSECRSKRRDSNGGHLQPVLRMAKWKIILHNAMIRAKGGDESLQKTVPSDWAEWYQRKIEKGSFSD